jgi:uncharacterized protein YwlG (UPF0340 family)
LPLGITPDQWTPEYAAQILQLAREGFAQNPDLPRPQPGIVPMGAPGSLNPPTPPMAPKIPQSGSLVPMSTPAEAAPAAPAPKPGGGWGDKMQSMLPLLAAMAYGSNPRTSHMAPIALRMGERLQEQAGSREAAQLMMQGQQIASEKGPEAAKKFWTDAATSKTGSPLGTKLAAEQLQKVSERLDTRDAANMLLSKDPKKIAEAIPTIYANLGSEKANALIKTLKDDNKVQFLQTKSGIYVGDPMMRTVQKVESIPQEITAADVGGTDVTQVLTRMGLTLDEATPEQRQKAASIAAQEAREKEERSARQASQREGALAAALKAGIVQSSKNMADVMTKPVEREQAKEVGDLLSIEDNTEKLLREFTPAERAKYAGMGGLKMSYQQALQAVKGGQADPKFARFSALVNEAKGEAFKTAGKALTATEAAVVFGYIPTGEEWSAEQFEQKLNLSRERIGTAIDRRTELGTAAPGSMKGFVEEQRAKRPKARETTPSGRVIIRAQ